MTDTTLQETIIQLTDKSSSKRRSAAKILRKRKNFQAGPALLMALEKEMTDTRTWETQYQMIMAIAECGYIDALEYIVSLTTFEFQATMIYVALGDAVTRLKFIETQSADAAIDHISITKNKMIFDGTLRAAAMLRLIPNDQNIEGIINYGNALEINDNSRFWIAAAAAGWEGKKVGHFLADSEKSSSQQIQRAALASQKKQYQKWSPL